MRNNLIILFKTLVLAGLILACNDATSNNNNPINNFNIWRDSIPDPIGYVNDFENIFTDKEEDELTHVIDSIEKATSVQIAVVCWDKNTMPNKEFFELNLATANKWGVGQKGENNGIFFGLCIGLGKIRILNGYGIEAVYPDEKTKAVIDETILPYFKEGKYYSGIRAGILRMISELNKVL
jgi:uncharacterized protein